MNATRLEQALALGFSSIEEMEEHAVWLEERKQAAEKAKVAVQKADSQNSNIIDLR